MKNWSDKKILDYLMTSDFDDNLSPEELKHLIIKFRNFYRIVSSRSTSIEIEKKRFDFEIENLKKNQIEVVHNLTVQINKLSDIYQSLTSRKLTFSERFFGKLKPNSKETI